MIKSREQISLVERLIGKYSNKKLKGLEEAIDWDKIDRLMKGLYSEEKGRPGYGGRILFRCLLISQWYNLSDEETEEAIGDRLSFREFVGIGIEETSPDHSTISRFRSRLIEAGLINKIFEAVNQEIESRGLIVKKGTLIDATVITGHPKDGEANYCGNKKVHGYKVSVGVDQESGFVRKVDLMPANQHDQRCADALVCGDERAVYADKGYDSHKLRDKIAQLGIKSRLMHRIYPKDHSPRKQHLYTQLNRGYSRIRSSVERVFATLKRTYNYRYARYCGLERNRLEAFLKMIAFNLRKLLLNRA